MNISAPKIVSVGLAVPKTGFSQHQVATYLQIKSEKGLRFFNHPHIQKRHLSLPADFDLKQSFVAENTDALLKRFKSEALKISAQAINECLRLSGRSIADIDLLCCVTSTGFIVPALSALLIDQLQFKNDCQRLDIVGMGCNAGLNGLNAVAHWARANPGKQALLVCCEVCSAIYATDESEESALVNSLFGDGAAAAIVSTDAGDIKKPVAEILGFSSYIIPKTLELLRFDWQSETNRYCFVVDKKTPATIAEKVNIPLRNLLKNLEIDRPKIKHWVVHSGGEAILQGVQQSLGLTETNLEHTRSVLRDFGNVSSGSFLFSYARLQQTNQVRVEDLGVMMTMGPGLTIELAGLKWVSGND